MRFSRSLKSSNQSLPSPNGAYIATVLPSKLAIRATRTLEIIKSITLPASLSTSVPWFQWSKLSDRILLASNDHIRVISVTSQFQANISCPAGRGGTKVTAIAFATDDEICVFSEFGLKVSIYSLLKSSAFEIAQPKLFNAGVASKGFSYRPVSLNLALLTRNAGKDIISVHAPDTLEVIRSWVLETIDAQGIAWSPDGKWLTVWESATQGHKALFYTADGHLYRAWNGPNLVVEDPIDIDLRPGVKLLEWSPSSVHVAVADHSERVTVLATPSFSESMSLFHTANIKSTEALQIWQEQVTPSPTGGLQREFIEAPQNSSPPTASTTSETNNKIGVQSMAFDHSGSLLVTRVESMPTTVWIWDIGTKILRALMILHAPVVRVSWHPTIDELIMIRCEGDESKGLVHAWDPSWATPKIIDFTRQMPGGKFIGRTVVRWLSIDSPTPALYFSDSQDCILASVASEDNEEEVPWESAQGRAVDIYSHREESPLSLVPADESFPYDQADDDSMTKMLSGSEELDDTFQFRRAADP